MIKKYTILSFLGVVICSASVPVVQAGGWVPPIWRKPHVERPAGVSAEKWAKDFQLRDNVRAARKGQNPDCTKFRSHFFDGKRSAAWEAKCGKK